MMESETKDAIMTSRRNFGIRLAATLAAVPIVGGMLACKQDGSRNVTTPDGATPSGPLPRRRPCAPLGLEPQPHEPPIGFGDGSLVMDVPLSCRLRQLSDGGAPRPFRYEFTSARYTSIKEVRVLTRPTSGFPFFMRYDLPANPDYQLRIWLVQLSASSGSEQNLFESPGTEAQLVLSATSPHVQTELRLIPGADDGYSHKRAVPLRYDYPALARHFHIGQWQITDSRGSVVQDVVEEEPFSDSNNDSYQIFVTFNHP